MRDFNAPSLIIAQVQVQDVQTHLTHRIHDAKDCGDAEEMTGNIDVQAAMPVGRVVDDLHCNGSPAMVRDGQCVEAAQASRQPQFGSGANLRTSTGNRQDVGLCELPFLGDC